MKQSDRVLQDDEDFLVEVIDWHGQLAVKKSIKSSTRPERVERLKNEAYGLRFFAKLANSHPNLMVYIPHLYEADDGYIVTEYITDPPVGDDLKNLGELAGLLAGIDRVEPYGAAMIVPNFDYKNIRNRLHIWIEEPLRQGIITQDQIDRANQIIDKYEPYLQPRIAHGDLSPYAHAFMRPDGKIALVDLEVFTPDGARYYDVARCYTRLYSYAKSAAPAKQFLKFFIEKSDQIERRQEQLLAILVQRTMGMQRDAVVDSAKGDNYKERAKELLDLVLQDDLELLYR